MSALDKVMSWFKGAREQGQDMAAKGRDMAGDALERGQDMAAKGQDMAGDAIDRGQDLAAKGQDMAGKAVDEVKEHIPGQGGDADANA